MKNSLSLHRILLTLSVCAFLGACGGGGGSSNGSEPDRVSGTNARASLGSVADAAVVAIAMEDFDINKYIADQKQLVLDSVPTDERGETTRPLKLGGYNGPVLYALVVDDRSAYFDEATGTEHAIPPHEVVVSDFFPEDAWDAERDNGSAGIIMYAFTTSPRETVGITPLTTMATHTTVQEHSRLMLSSIDTDLIRLVNQAVGEVLAPELDDILVPAAVFDANTTSGSLDDNPAGRYALKLAALAQLGEASANPALRVLRVLTLDFWADGLGDGGNLYDSFDQLRTQLEDALVQMAQDYGTPELQAAVAAYPPISREPDSDTGNDGNPAAPGTVTGSADGTTYEFSDIHVQRYEPGQVLVVLALSNDMSRAWGLTLRLDQGGNLDCEAQAQQAVVTFNPGGGESYSAPSDEGHPSCAITINTNNSDTLGGTFHGTLFNDDGDEMSVTHGAFNLDLPDSPVGSGS